jgi:hypothetical protein
MSAPRPVDPRDVLVSLGLGRPSARAFVVGVAATGIFYFAKYPSGGFRDDGTVRPFGPLTPGPDGVTDKHFLVAPMIIATAVYLCT